jgi:hypothetical protein
MRMRFRWLTATLGALLALTLVPGTATASVPTWVSDPSSCTNVTTMDEWKSGDRFVQLRKGKCGSTYYVWGRANGNRVVQMGIYTNSPWKLTATDKTQNGSGNTHYTRGRKAEFGLTYVADAGSGTAVVYSP